jgi:putative flippase GtrA
MSATDTPRSWQQRIFSLIEWLKTFRYVKFGIVGASGTVVNMVVLYVAQEYLFSAIESPRIRLSAALVVAILVATLNNFTWNRLWTWADRQQADAHALSAPASASGTSAVIRRLTGQFGRYCFASWFGMALQYGLTLWLSHYWHYLVANVFAIVVASVVNFLANDRWTFRQPPKQ